MIIYILYIFLYLLSIDLAACLYISYITVKPKSDKYDTDLYLDGIAYEDLILETHDGFMLSAWHFMNHSDKAVIIVAGIKSNRLDVINKAKYYYELGFDVIVGDLRGTGQSQSSYTSFGWYERNDIQAFFHYAIKNPKIKTIGLHGVSLGAAAVCYAYEHVRPCAFVVIESCYDTIGHALKNRTRLFLPDFLLFLSFPMRYITPIFTWVKAYKLKPVEYVGKINCPLFIMAGDSELVLPKHETMSIIKAAKKEICQHYFFKGARHENLYRFDPSTYKVELKKFLKSIQLSN